MSSNFREVVQKSWDDNRLLSVLLELTYRCNLDCFFCYNDVTLKGKPLSLEQYYQLLDDLRELNVLNVTLSGGEPLAHRDFFAIGKRARDLGFVVRIKSNGHALRSELAQRLRDEVDPFVIEVSLHGATAEIHDRQTRVAGSFDRLRENIAGMLALGMRVKVNSTLTLWNEDQVEPMYALTDSFGIPLRFDLQVTPRDDGDQTPLNVTATQDGIRNLLAVESRRYEALYGPAAVAPTRTPLADDEVPAGTGKHCGAGSAGIAIDPYGSIYPCVQWRRPVASLHDVRINQLWGESAVLREIRTTTEEAARVVAEHAHGALLNFCPGLAELLTGSPVQVPVEMTERAELIAEATAKP